MPCPRAGHTALVKIVKELANKPFMYIFGGKDVENNKMNDLWRLDLETFKWELMNPAGKIPMERSGHSADYF